MEIVPLGPGFAAELRGVTIHDVAASEAAYAAVRAAFEEHSVLVLRDQDVTDEAQLAFSRRFGPLEVTKVSSDGYGTNLVILKTLDEKGKRSAGRSPARLGKQGEPALAYRQFVQAGAGARFGAVVAHHSGAGGRDRVRLHPALLRAPRSGVQTAAGKFLRLARIRLFARQDRARPCRPGGAGGAAAAMLASCLPEAVMLNGNDEILIPRLRHGNHHRF